MMHHIDDLLVGAGLILLGIGVYILAGWVAVLFYAGFVLLLAGVAIGIKANGRVDRSAGR